MNLREHMRRLAGSPLLLVAAFVFVAGPTIFRHEMWHDELNSWDVARDAHSLPGLFANMHFEAHPALWYLCLYAITRVTTDPRAMQALHLAIATASVALIAWASPFRTVERWLLAFGYFFVFEFAVISRGYALGVLFALAICLAYTRPQPKLVVVAVLLALLANTSLYGVFLAIAIGAGILIENRFPRDARLAAAALLVGAAIVLAMRTLYPAPDNAFAPEWHTRVEPTRIEGVLDLAWAAYVPLPDFAAPSPWNSNLLGAEGASILHLPRGVPAAVLGIVLMVIIAVAFRSDRASLAMHLVMCALVLGFIYLKYSGGMRHHGHLFVALVCGSWIARPTARTGPFRHVFALLLVSQLVAGLYFVREDLRGPFSFSEELTRYVRSLPRSTPVVVAQPAFLNFAGPVLSGYLRKPVTYVLGHGARRGSFMYPDIEHRRGASDTEMLEQFRLLSTELQTDLYVVTNNWEPSALGPPLAHFDRHLEGDERSSDVYLFKYQR